MTGVRALHALRIGMLVLWLAAAVAASQAGGLSGRIVGVVDGDTVDLLTDSKQLIRVRLAGIDAPERRQPFGSVAKKVLSELVFSKPALLEGEKKDRYGRLIAKVIVGGQDANLRLVRLGYAWHFKKYQKEQSAEDRRLYDAAQAAAMKDRVGLWADPEPVAPWDFRASRRGDSSK
jgi:endonuclease YncB( thermonuclease family)